MSKNSTYDPFDTLTKLTVQMENQVNDLVYQLTDNKEFVGLLKRGTNIQALLQERLNKNNGLLASKLNIPTKNDLADVAKIAIQTEEKLDSLEEQLWNLTDFADRTNREIESIVAASSEVLKVAKQLNSELAELKKDQAELSELKKEFTKLKEEMSSMKEFITFTISSELKKGTEMKQKKSKQAEPVTSDNKN
ncbi:MAG TPA: polyhydroxyalkanoate biosynthesis repressor PhaR [Ureibacillus sp.]|nr:polyhydroxyalkanoate biosynthesis repressor PhaR [Ureibacillus sp.]